MIATLLPLNCCLRWKTRVHSFLIAGDEDIQAITQNLTFTPNQYQVNVSINITNDNIAETSESFTARIIVSEVMSQYDTSIMITIEDDDGKRLHNICNGE